MAVFKRQDTWWIDYYYQGHRYREKIGKKKDAETTLSQIKIKKALGEFVPKDEREQQEPEGAQLILFESFVREEFLPWSEVQYSARHYGNLGLILGVHLIPYFEGISLDKITPKIVENYVSKRSRGTYRCGKGKRRVKPATVNRDIACLKILFRKAIEWGHLVENPARSIKTLKEIPNPLRLLEEEEIIRFQEEMPPHLSGPGCLRSVCRTTEGRAVPSEVGGYQLEGRGD